jgi:hypothetical protein
VLMLVRSNRETARSVISLPRVNLPEAWQATWSLLLGKRLLAMSTTRLVPRLKEPLMIVYYSSRLHAATQAWNGIQNFEGGKRIPPVLLLSCTCSLPNGTKEYV